MSYLLHPTSRQSRVQSAGRVESAHTFFFFIAVGLPAIMEKMADKGITGLQVLDGAMAVLLLLCFFDVPYGFFICFATIVAFSFFSYKEYQDYCYERMFLIILLAVFFLPFVTMLIKMWVLVAIVVAIFLLFKCLIGIARPISRINIV